MPVDFNSLYDIYNSNNLVVIAGSEMVLLHNRDGAADQPEKTFERKAIERIMNDPELPVPKTLSEVAIRYPQKGLSSNKLSGIYNDVRQQDFDLSLLEVIADLPKVNLFIQTSFDNKLQQLLSRDAESIPEIFVWNHKSREPVYLDIDNGKKKIVYLFGNTDAGISVFEEEQIDCLLNLTIYNEVNKNRSSLLEYLKDKTLIFMGNNFPDWFMRLMIRTLYNAPITSQPEKAYIINDNTRDVAYERYFFDKFKIELIYDHPIAEFLSQLHATIRAREEFINWYAPKKIFISYKREDSAYAEALKQCLNRKHIEAFLDTQDMGIADHQKKITKLIQSTDTCIFICILSQALAAEDHAESYVKRIEWEMAAARFKANEYMDQAMGEGLHPPFFIVPVSVDDFKQYSDKLPDFITRHNVQQLSPEKICEQIAETFKNDCL